MWPTELAQSLLYQGRVGEHPAVQGGVIHLHTAFQEHLSISAVAERVAQLPGDRLDDQPRLVVPTPEVGLAHCLSLAAIADRIMGQLQHGAAS